MEVNMLVKEIMSEKPDSLTENSTLTQAAEEMQKHDFGFIPIKRDNQVVGVVTDRDIIIRAISKGKDPNKTILRDAMTKDIHFCHEEDDINKAAQMMCNLQINRLAVYDKNEHLSGVISIGDIVRNTKDINLCGKITEAIHEK